MRSLEKKAERAEKRESEALLSVKRLEGDLSSLRLEAEAKAAALAGAKETILASEARLTQALEREAKAKATVLEKQRDNQGLQNLLQKQNQKAQKDLDSLTKTLRAEQNKVFNH